MNQQAYEAGRHAYQSSDWVGAVTFLSGALGQGEVSGEVSHLLGNAYMKLGQYDAAARAYESALADASYGKRGSDEKYATPYKAYMALGSAYEQLGDIRRAGMAYRSAAIDEANTAPSVALSNLGSCFMRLGRAVDAVEAYRTALDFTTPLESQNKIWCDLGLAYVAANRMGEAVDAFAHATADGTYQLSPEAQASYDAARKAMAALAERRPSETDALLAAAGYGSYDPLDPTGESGELMPSPEDTGFFSVTEEDLMEADKKERKVRRKHRHSGLKVFIVILVLLLAVVGAGVFAYVRGYGWPTQETVAERLFNAKADGVDIAEYMVEGTSEDVIEQTLDVLPTDATIQVNGCDRSMTESTVHLTATLSAGGEMDYTLTMRRDGVGWKVSEVTPEYRSQDQAGTTSND